MRSPARRSIVWLQLREFPRHAQRRKLERDRALEGDAIVEADLGSTVRERSELVGGDEDRTELGGAIASRSVASVRGARALELVETGKGGEDGDAEDRALCFGRRRAGKVLSEDEGDVDAEFGARLAGGERQARVVTRDRARVADAVAELAVFTAPAELDEHRAIGGERWAPDERVLLEAGLGRSPLGGAESGVELVEPERAEGDHPLVEVARIREARRREARVEMLFRRTSLTSS